MLLDALTSVASQEMQLHSIECGQHGLSGG